MQTLEGLNPSQKKAVETVEGRVLVLAGAGSGKTRVITLRMVHLITQKSVEPEALLGLTFTNKAAAEMRKRIASLIDRDCAERITLTTFHSFCMQILRKEIELLGYTKKFTLYDEQDVERLVKMIARDILGVEGELPSITSAMAAMNRARQNNVLAEDIIGTGSQWHDTFSQELYTRFQQSMKAYDAVDFDNLLWLTVQLFEQFPEVLQKYQDRYRYIMIDEYQDTNPIQYRLSELLSAKYGNLCVVGDDDQSIYGWRGAEVKNILEFDRACVVTLEQNYRSSSTILKGSNAVIQNNQGRHGKALWSERGTGSLIEVFHAPGDIEEAQAVVFRLDSIRKTKGLDWCDCAILYRSNALSRQFELALMRYNWQEGERWRNGIPYKVYGGLEFYKRKEVKDLIAYMRCIANPNDHEAILRIINQPRRGIGEGTLGPLVAHHREKGIPLWNLLNEVVEDRSPVALGKNRRAIEGIHRFVAALKGAKDKFEKEPFHEGMRWLIETIDYKKAIAEEIKSEQMRTFKWENVEEFVTSIQEYESSNEGGSLQDFITTIPLDNDWAKMKERETSKNSVSLMTFHSAKGLEFPACFLVGMEDHILPHERSLGETGVEEERRLMYVAMTRAKDYLTISMARKRKRMGKEYPSEPSRFLFEIPQELLKTTQWHDV